VGKASRRKRVQGHRPSPARRSHASGGDRASDVRSEAEAAMARLVRTNPPGKVSLAGAYALGYGALAMAQIEDDGPDWFHDLDPLETLFLGTVWPQAFRDSYEFANACWAWLRMLRDTVHWTGIERFVAEALAASEQHDLAVDEGELMLLLFGRLEPADLDQSKLPRDLLPDRALQGARFIGVPAADCARPDAPPDVADRIAKFWASCEIELPGDGTAVDGLREGLHLLSTAGMDVREDSAVLLPALYIGLVAADDEEIGNAGERAVAWALGLDEDSSLVRVTNVLLAAAEDETDVDTALARLFGVSAFTEQVRPEDRLWHSSPGAALVRLAFEFGHRQVITLKGKTVSLGGGANALIEAQRRKFEEKFGRPMGPDDPVFFDPDADEPQPFSLLEVENETVAMLEAAGISPAWIYAYQHTDGLLPRADGGFVSEQDRAEWNEAVDRYVRLHQPGVRVDHNTETRKLQKVLAGMTLHMVATDPEYGASLVGRLGASADSGDDEALMRQYLRSWADDLVHELCDPAVASAATEYARAWVGGDLADRVRETAAGPCAADSGLDVLLAVAAAVGRRTTDMGGNRTS
jgi:hypothetical protein